MKPCDVKKSVRKLRDFLIIQLNRFVEIEGTRKKFTRTCSVIQQRGFLSVQLKMCSSNNASTLEKMIIHSGNLVSGHYTVIIKDVKTGAYLNFNDRAIKFCSRSDLANGNQ